MRKWKCRQLDLLRNKLWKMDSRIKIKFKSASGSYRGYFNYMDEDYSSVRNFIKVLTQDCRIQPPSISEKIVGVHKNYPATKSFSM